MNHKHDKDNIVECFCGLLLLKAADLIGSAHFNPIVNRIVWTRPSYLTIFKYLFYCIIAIKYFSTVNGKMFKLRSD